MKCFTLIKYEKLYANVQVKFNLREEKITACEIRKAKFIKE